MLGRWPDTDRAVGLYNDLLLDVKTLQCTAYLHSSRMFLFSHNALMENRNFFLIIIIIIIILL